MTEDGVHLNIRKGMLREWRKEFARHLRAQGVAATATPRAERRETGRSRLTDIYRPVNGRQASRRQTGWLQFVAQSLN